MGRNSYLAAFGLNDERRSRLLLWLKRAVRWDRVAIIAGCALFWAIAAFLLR